MSTIESDMLGYEERGTVGDPSARSTSSSAARSQSRRPWSPPEAEAAKKLSTLIRDIGVAMLTTVAPDGSLRSRPMATQGQLENGEIWFFTSDDSGKVAEIEQEHEVNLAYAEPKDQRYVSISGRATLVRDPARARRMWNSEAMAWFPDGPEDARLALLRVRMHTAEYWDAPEGRMASLYALAKSTLTGQAAGQVGEHEKILPRR